MYDRKSALSCRLRRRSRLRFGRLVWSLFLTFRFSSYCSIALLESFKDTSINTSYSHTHDRAVVIIFVYSDFRKSEICDREVDASSTHRALFPSSAETARTQTSTPTPPNLHVSIPTLCGKVSICAPRRTEEEPSKSLYHRHHLYAGRAPPPFDSRLPELQAAQSPVQRYRHRYTLFELHPRSNDMHHTREQPWLVRLTPMLESVPSCADH